MRNPDQLDHDSDGEGDACDADIDNDGLSNEVEDHYPFLDSHDDSDANLDFDGDGVSNLYETQLGTQPDIADEHEPINLLDYFPLGEINYAYSNGTSLTNVTFEPTNNSNRYRVTTNLDDWVTYIERRSDGIHIIRDELGDGTDDMPRFIYSGWIYIPKEMMLGETLNLTISIKGIIDGESTDFQPMTATIQLIEVTEMEWNNQTYPAIKIRRWFDDGTTEEAYYLKNIGQLETDGMPLATSDFVSLDDNSSASGGSGGGAGLFWMTWMLALLVLFRGRDFGRSQAQV